MSAALYEACPHCGGCGLLRESQLGASLLCPACVPRRVVPAGATAAQLESAVRRATAYEAALRELLEAVAAGGGRDTGRLVAALSHARHVLAMRGRTPG